MQKSEKMKSLRVFAEQIRVETLKEIKTLGFGHVGGSMSIIETLACLYGDVMNIDPKDPRKAGRDWLVTSKGHAGPSVYATLALKGFFPMEELATLNKPHTNLPSHTDRNKTAGIDMTTGSLGQGVSTAIGATLGNRIDKNDAYTYLIVGDGECNEGQVWEGAMFASHYKLDKLIMFVDHNKRQLDGSCEDILNPLSFEDKFNAFGFYTQSIDGNDIEAVYDAIMNAKANTGKPSCIVLNTIKGRGCTFAESTGAHSSQVSAEQFDEAIAVAEKYLEQVKNA